MSEQSLTEAIKFLMDRGATNANTCDAPNGDIGFIVPNGYRIEWRHAVERTLGHIAERASFDDVASFADYVNAYKGEGDSLRIFADAKIGHVEAILNYHDAAEADYCDHIATYIAPFSAEWLAWKNRSGVMMDAMDFAEFLEERAGEIVSPEQADIVEMCMDLKVSTTSEFSTKVNTQTGRVQFSYQEDERAKSGSGKLDMVREISLAIPVFFASAPVPVKALLRYRVKDGKLLLGVKLLHAERIEQEAFLNEVKSVTELTGAAPHLGRVLDRSVAR